MDMIYSVSTFSHFGPDDQKAWLAELHRILKPGGYCFLTTEAWKAYTAGGLSALFANDAESAAALLAAEGILYTEYDWLKSEMTLRHLSPKANRVYGLWWCVQLASTVAIVSIRGTPAAAALSRVLDNRGGSRTGTTTGTAADTRNYGDAQHADSAGYDSPRGRGGEVFGGQ